jgi:hypothetical protein
MPKKEKVAKIAKPKKVNLDEGHVTILMALESKVAGLLGRVDALEAKVNELAAGQPVPPAAA